MTEHVTNVNEDINVTYRERRSRFDSGSIQTPTLGEKQGHHTSSSKARMLERFAREAVELLRASPQCRILLQRFASCWCKHFNRPLRLADFGCVRLMELLDEVSDTIQVSVNFY